MPSSENYRVVVGTSTAGSISVIVTWKSILGVNSKPVSNVMLSSQLIIYCVYCSCTNTP